MKWVVISIAAIASIIAAQPAQTGPGGKIHTVTPDGLEQLPFTFEIDDTPGIHNRFPEAIEILISPERGTLSKHMATLEVVRGGETLVSCRLQGDEWRGKARYKLSIADLFIPETIFTFISYEANDDFGYYELRLADWIATDPPGIR